MQLDIFIPPFYNTIASNGNGLKTYHAECRNQQDMVLQYFKMVKRSTALQAAISLKMHEVSARRSVTNLFKSGQLIKTDDQVIEKYGKKNFIYQICV